MTTSFTRIVGLDVARALAVIGMVIVNYKVVMVSESTQGLLATATGLLEGRAAATFVVLAGIGLSLMTRRARSSEDRDLIRDDRNMILRRALFLFVVGLAYTPLWPPDILHFYGAYLAIAAFLIVASTRRLWALTVGFTIGFVILISVLDYEAGWDWETLDYSGFWTPVGFVRNLFFNGFHPVFPWTAFVLVGMWLGRIEISNTRIRRRILAIAAIVAATTEVVSTLLVRFGTAGLTGTEADEFALVLGTQMIPPMPLYMIAGTATAIVVILLSIELTERVGNAAWLKPLVYTGQLALTLYVAHVLVGMGLLESTGLLYDQSLEFAVTAALAFSVAAIAFSWAWRSRFPRGPLEWVLRKLT